MKIIHVSSEVYPFSKTGGLADVVGSLPKYQTSGNIVMVFSPLYSCVFTKIQPQFTGQTVSVSVENGKSETFELWKHASDGVLWYFLKNDRFFTRDGIYGNNGTIYIDNPLRYGTFCKAVLNFVLQNNWEPDIWHCHDWQTSFIPVWMENDGVKGGKVIFTIHNMAYQGRSPKSVLSELGMSLHLYQDFGIEWGGQANFMKGAICFSDSVTTVSPTYMQEILYDQGFGLEPVLKYYQQKLTGIVNGLDYDVWNPETDSHIPSTYSSSTFSNRAINKKEICEEFGLDFNRPLFTMVSRLTSQKGVDLVLGCAEDLTKEGSFILCGDGEKYFSDAFDAKSQHNPHMIAHVGFHETLSHRLYAAADFYLMPSLYEPCGLAQLMAMRYGAMPIVRRTGGLKDTVTPFHESGGVGILFDQYDATAFRWAIETAVSLYREGKVTTYAKRAMGQDFSWQHSAKNYLALYQKILRKTKDPSMLLRSITASDAVEISLPASYNADILVGMPVNSGFVYVHWELTEKTLQAAHQYTKTKTSHPLTLRLFKKMPPQAECVYETQIPSLGERDIFSYLPGSTVWVEIGILRGTDDWFRIITSTQFTLPRDRFCEEVDAADWQWADVNAVLKMSVVGPHMGISSMEQHRNRHRIFPTLQTNPWRPL